MYTGVYFPTDWVATSPKPYYWSEGDHTDIWNGNAFVERPSYSVMMLVFDYDYDKEA